MKTIATLLTAMALAALGATTAMAQQQPTGVWIDHTGRGAVEIADCGGGALCGYVVWVKDAKNNKACRTQIIGNAKPVGGGAWDRGWIVDPDDNQRYSVELKPIGEDRLRVTGYQGSKLFSETMMWKRAPAGLQRCDIQEAAAPRAPAATPVPALPAPAVVLPPPQIEPPAPASAPVMPAPAEQFPREAAAPPVAPPVAAPEQVPPRAAEAVPEPERRRPSREANNTGKRKSASKDCKLDLPYITLKYPCDAF